MSTPRKSTSKRKRPAGGKRAASRRDRLQARPRPSVTFPLLVVDPAAAQQRVDAAARALRQARKVHDPDEHASDDPQERAEQERRAKQLADAEAEADAADAELSDCYEMVKLTALRPDDYEELIGQHPPSDEQHAAGEIWNPDTFKAALIAACSDDDLGADEWAVFLAEQCSRGEAHALWTAALAINEDFRAAGSAVPKGLTQIRS